MIRHILFDLDHTLWDFDANSLSAMHLLYERYNLADCFESFDDFHTRYLRHNTALWHQYALGEVDKATVQSGRFFRTMQEVQRADVAMADSMGAYYLDTTASMTRLMPRALSTLRALRDNGYRLYIVTNGFREVQHRKVRLSGLDSYISHMFISDEVGAMKPSRRFFQYALDYIPARPEECAMVGDNLETDILGASAMGIRPIYYNSRAESNDYRGERIDSLDQLIPIFIGTSEH